MTLWVGRGGVMDKAVGGVFEEGSYEAQDVPHMRRRQDRSFERIPPQT